MIRQLEAHGRVERGYLCEPACNSDQLRGDTYLGIFAQALTPEVATALHVEPYGHALITALDPEGPAAESFAVGDVLVSINSAPATFKTLSTMTARLVPNALATIKIIRDGKEQSLALKVARLPDPPDDSAASGAQDTWVPALGFGVSKATLQHGVLPTEIGAFQLAVARYDRDSLKA